MAIETIEKKYVARYGTVGKNGATGSWILIVPKEKASSLNSKNESSVSEGIKLAIKSQTMLSISYVENEEDKLLIAGYYCLNLPVGNPNGILNT